MNIIKNINESMKTLYESLLDDFEKLEDSINPIDEIKKFLRDNYLKFNILKISKKPNKDGLYEVDCRRSRMVKVKNKEITSLTNGMFEFVEVDYFCCSYCDNLTSLEGSPKKCEVFNCSGCKNLTSLEGAPEEVGGNFNCTGCNNLITLKGSPIKVEGYFYCTDCDKLTSLKGAPKVVEGGFDCSYCSNLTTLEGSPKKCQSFNCRGCNNLTSFEGMPEQIGENLGCSSCTPGNTLGMGNPMPPTDNANGTEPIIPTATKKKKKKTK